MRNYIMVKHNPTKLFGVFSAVTRGKEFDSRIHWRTLLRSAELLTMILKLYPCDRVVLSRQMVRLEKALSKMIVNNGLKTVAKAIKRIEHSYMLNNEYIYCEPLWISKSLFFPLSRRKGKPILPLEVSRLLLGIHRNMSIQPEISVESIQTPSGSHLWERVATKYADELQRVGEKIRRIAAPIVNSIMGDYHVKISPKFKHAAWNYIGNLSNDPTVDSNDRTDGLVHPLRVTLATCVNGPAISSQLMDAHVLCREENSKIKESLEWIFKMLDYKVNIDKDSSLLSKGELKNSDSWILSRIEALRDKSCKTRTIAIFDTYSQVALRPFHRLWEDFLRVLKNDHTFDHSRGVFNLMKAHRRTMGTKAHGNHRNKFYSFDISSATDTIPKELGFWSGYQVLTALINGQFTEAHCRKTMDAVQTVLIDRDFKTPVGGSVRYTCGQPMGAYGSFPLLALSQHTLVWLACEIVGINNHDTVPYAVVGDDLVIYHDEVALKYRELCEELSIPINTDKSIISDSKFEFCKRIYVDGKLRNFPALSAHYVAAVTRSPGPLLDLFQRFRLRTPHYHKCGSYFGYAPVRAHMAFMNLRVYGGPTSGKLSIPRAVKTHADRCLFVADMLDVYDKKTYKVSDPNPFVKRLGYGPQILSIFKKNFESLDKSGVSSLWMKILKIRANTFYLAYHMAYKHVKELNRLKRNKVQFVKLNEQRQNHLFRFIMANRNAWSHVKRK
jgi:hypothetical protein